MALKINIICDRCGREETVDAVHSVEMVEPTLPSSWTQLSFIISRGNSQLQMVLELCGECSIINANDWADLILSLAKVTPKKKVEPLC